MQSLRKRLCKPQMLNKLFAGCGCTALRMCWWNSTLLHSDIQQQCRDEKEMFPSVLLLLSHPTDKVAFSLLKLPLSLAGTKPLVLPSYCLST